jgi:hypothetical protein
MANPPCSFDCLSLVGSRARVGTSSLASAHYDLDYLAKHPEDSKRAAEATRLLAAVGHSVKGWAIRAPWPKGLIAPEGVGFFSGPVDASPPGKLYPVTGRSLHDAIRTGGSLRGWIDATVQHLEGQATVVVSPQVLAKVDPRLTALEDLILAARAAGFPMRTLREAT